MVGGSVNVAVRMSSAQEFVEHDTQAVDVSRGGNGVVADLLRRRVLECQDCFVRPREATVIRGAPFQQFRDSEIEQLYGSLASDQDVGRLEVAVNDQVGMCMS